ncbi:MAG: gamma carbonic anhydrase family protein [bacterium]|nr:gamma carbonic anhydrase family protein [bacterium]
MNSTRFPLFGLEHTFPQIASTTWIAPNAAVIGNVRIGEYSSVWFSVTIRGDVDSIEIGHSTNIQDGSVIHVDIGYPVRIGNFVTVGHQAILHGCTIEDEALIGIGSIVLNGAIIRKGAMVGAGALVPPGMEVPSGSLVLGTPAKVKRILSEDERLNLIDNAKHYVENAQRFYDHLRQ